MAVRGTRVYVAKESFAYTDENGVPAIIKAGQRVREGHSVLDGREDLFKLDDEILEAPEAARRPSTTK